MGVVRGTVGSEGTRGKNLMGGGGKGDSGELRYQREGFDGWRW